MRKPICLSIIFTGFLILVGVQLTTAQKIPTPLAQQLVKDYPYVKEKMREQRWTIAQLAGQINEVKKVDLNGDGKPEFIFSGIVCGNANCSTWVYGKNGNRYVRMLQTVSIDVKISKTKTNGYFDIAAEGHGGADGNEIHIHKFDGSEYQIKECLSKKYGYYDGKSSKIVTYKTPKITKIKCGS